MEGVIRLLGEVPKGDVFELLHVYGYLNVFGVWLAFMTVVLVGMWMWQRHSNQQVLTKWGIPGPKADSLLFGHYMTLQKKPIEVIHEWTKKYGSVFGYYIGEAPVVAIADAEIIRDLFIKSLNVFTERPPFAVKSYPVTKTLLCLPHDHWKTARSVFSPAFSAAKLKLMMRLMNDSAQTMIKVGYKRLTFSYIIQF